MWGTADPWEPIKLGRELANFPQVQKFIPLEGVGHCPQDEAPELVNPILLDWIWERKTVIDLAKLKALYCMPANHKLFQNPY